MIGDLKIEKDTVVDESITDFTYGTNVDFESKRRFTNMFE